MARSRRAHWAAAAIASAGLCGVATLSALGNFAGTAPAQSAQGTRAALVNLDDLFSGLDEIDARQRIFADKIRPWEDELQKMVDEMKSIDDDLKTLSLSEEQRVEMRLRMAELSESHKVKAQLRGQLATIEEGRILREVYNKALEAVQKVAEEGGYDLVLLDDRAIRPPESARATSREVQAAMLGRQVLFARGEGLDITQQVVTRMNNDYAAGK